MLLIAYLIIGMLFAAATGFRVAEDFGGRGPLLERIGLVALPMLLALVAWPVYLSIWVWQRAVVPVVERLTA